MRDPEPCGGQFTHSSVPSIVRSKGVMLYTLDGWPLPAASIDGKFAQSFWVPPIVKRKGVILYTLDGWPLPASIGGQFTQSFWVPPIVKSRAMMLYTLDGWPLPASIDGQFAQSSSGPPIVKSEGVMLYTLDGWPLPPSSYKTNQREKKAREEESSNIICLIYSHGYTWSTDIFLRICFFV